MLPHDDVWRNRDPRESSRPAREPRGGERDARPARAAAPEEGRRYAAETGSGSSIPASDASMAALSVRSHGRSRSSRPKWPYAAVWR
jgi:hypothetical protein